MLCRYIFHTVLGDMTVLTYQNKIASAYLGPDQNNKEERMKKLFFCEIENHCEKAARLFEGCMQNYLAGGKEKFDLPFDLRGTPFQKAVYAQLLNIPYGETVTYKEIAVALNSKACRAVGSAVDSNPVIIAVPCHRVIKSDKGLGGYSGFGGIETKKALLKIEGIYPAV